MQHALCHVSTHTLDTAVFKVAESESHRIVHGDETRLGHTWYCIYTHPAVLVVASVALAA